MDTTTETRRRHALIELRRAKYRFAAQLARAAGISPGALYDIETGRRRGERDTLQRIADALGVPLDAIADPDECDLTCTACGLECGSPAGLTSHTRACHGGRR